ncbi:uncharacterized protein LOC121530527 [Drosophila eugracilis]|uniref:uncharacterized protein LOC121530527 n=1 Tax=Drosophila eugracilis TaxID=29029 RepID=UPI001BD9D5D9|nr:uncharacterized protein LOC121530527 [Drosophila eugracilis]
MVSETVEVQPLVEFTNIKCDAVDPNFCKFEYCLLKSVNRTYKYFMVKLNLYKTPLTKAKVNFAIYKFANGYKPFLYNITVDACKFLQNPKSNPVTNYVYGFIKDFSNINHSCPYNDDFVVDKITTEFFNQRVKYLLPFPEGKYLFQMNWMPYGIMRAVFKIYIILS